MMGKTTEGIYVCDFCGEDTGKFDDETGNHPTCAELAILRGAVQDVLGDFDLFGQPVSLAVLERLRKAYRREYEHFCVCGHNEDMHCALAAPFDGANTACANGGCTCNEYRPAQ